MWELTVTINGQEQEQLKQQFEEIREGRKPFRNAVKQVFDENPQLLPKYIAMIDAYCDKYFPVKKRHKKPVPATFDKLKRLLTNYVTNAAYNINPDEFYMSKYTDKNISIWLSDYDGQLDVSTRIINKKLKLSFPSLHIPLRLIDNEDELSTGHYFSISDGIGLVGGKVTIWLDVVKPEEYFDEDEYDEDDLYDDDDEDEDDDYYDDDEDDEDYDDDEDEEEVTRSYAPPSRAYSGYSRPATPAPQQPKPLNAFERAELNCARSSYNKAVDEHKMHRNSSSASSYESLEKKAFARLMQVEAKYAGRK